MTSHEEVIHVITKLRLFFFGREDEYLVDVYDGGIRLVTISGTSRDEAREKAVAWVHNSFDIPKSIETMEEE